ncbi:MAG TPA: type II toxin-antitoxin system Phd/YefM family antitoxin [Solirubrobacterales bacterium]|nr:type II toxin-antitoxin system Phd/YefM family antitoxin [Solirubrobacterales bacterium]
MAPRGKCRYNCRHISRLTTEATMAVVGIRQLSRETSKVIQKFEETGEPVIVTREGRPIGALMPVGQTELQDLVLATAPESLELHQQAKVDLVEGRTRSLADAAAERGIELPSQETQAAAAETEAIAEPVAEDLAQLQDVFTEGSTIVADVNREAGTLSEDALATIRETAHEEPAPGEVRELSELTASVYGRMFQQYFAKSLARGEIERAIEKSHRQTRNVFLKMGRSMARRGEISFERYVGSLEGVEALTSGAEGGEGSSATPEASTGELPFSAES